MWWILPCDIKCLGCGESQNMQKYRTKCSKNKPWGMIDQPSVGFTRYEEGGTSTIRWIKVEGTHTCKVIMRYDMGCQYLYCSGQQILYRDEFIKN